MLRLRMRGRVKCPAADNPIIQMVRTIKYRIVFRENGDKMKDNELIKNPPKCCKMMECAIDNHFINFYEYGVEASFFVCGAKERYLMEQKEFIHFCPFCGKRLK